jgi:hypothetical protein
LAEQGWLPRPTVFITAALIARSTAAMVCGGWLFLHAHLLMRETRRKPITPEKNLFYEPPDAG